MSKNNPKIKNYGGNLTLGEILFLIGGVLTLLLMTSFFIQIIGKNIFSYVLLFIVSGVILFLVPLGFLYEKTANDNLDVAIIIGVPLNAILSYSLYNYIPDSGIQVFIIIYAILMTILLGIAFVIYVIPWLKQKKIKMDSINQEKQIINDSAKIKLRNHINGLLKNIILVSTEDEQQQKVFSMINLTIEELSEENDINASHYNDAYIQNDKKLIFEHLSHQGLDHHIIVKRLKNIFAVKEQASNNIKKDILKETADNKLRNYVNFIFKTVLQLPTTNAKDQERLLHAINNSINEITEDSDIKPIHYKDALIQMDKALILSYLAEHHLTEHLYIKRFKGLFEL